MKKIITFAGIAILFVLLSAPSFAKAETLYPIGQAYVNYGYEMSVVVLYCENQNVSSIYLSGGTFYAGGKALKIPRYDNPDAVISATTNMVTSGYIGTLSSNFAFNGSHYIYNNLPEFYLSLPEELRPAPTWHQTIWRNLLDLYHAIYGVYPANTDLLYILAGLTESDEQLELIFPTNEVTPTPTPIPVQTIYIPSGNGNYTIVYQYEDPNGNITQSPYNPNIDIDVNCDCNGTDYNPQNPMYYPFDGLTWAAVDSDLTGSPAMTAGQSLELIKGEVDSYDEPIKVVSNSFGALPGKWLSLVGLLGACLIVAGLIRTFLGG